MAERPKEVTWEAPEHHHIEKGNDWFWALGLVAVAGSAAAFVFGNILFGIVILLGAATMIVFALREPAIIPFAVTQRGLLINDTLYPYTTLEAYYIDEEDPLGPQLLARSSKLFMPLLIMPLPPEHINEIDEIIAERLPEEHLEEPFSHKLLEFFGF